MDALEGGLVWFGLAGPSWAGLVTGLRYNAACIAAFLLRTFSMPPKFLFFDLGKVLLDFDHPRMCQQVADVLGTSAARLEQLILPTKGTEKDPLWQLECGQIEEEAFFNWLCDEINRLDPKPEGNQLLTSRELLTQAASDIFSPIEASLDLVQRLYQANHRLGILSNTNSAHWRFVTDGRYPLLLECFESRLASFQIKAMKPAAMIYHAAAKAVSLKPEDIFFVDDREENVAGAIACGIDAVLFTSTAQLEKDLRKRGLEFA